MRNRLKSYLLAPAVLLFVAFPAKSQFGFSTVFCTNCASEPTAASIRIMHNLEYAKQLLQYATQVQHLADAVRNTAHGGPAALSNVSADLNQLSTVVQGGRAIAYSMANQDAAFRGTFPGYDPAYAAARGTGNYQNDYALWAQTTLATTQGILRGVGVQGRLLATEQGVLSVLKGLSASNLLNRNDAINLTSQLAAEQIGQIQKLRELQLEDMTSKAAFQGYIIQQQAASEAATKRFFNRTPEVSDRTTFQAGWK